VETEEGNFVAEQMITRAKVSRALAELRARRTLDANAADKVSARHAKGVNALAMAGELMAKIAD
jgi:arginine repressor